MSWKSWGWVLKKHPWMDQSAIVRTAISRQTHGLTYREGRTPTSSRTRKAMRLCRFQYSTAMATKSPPMNSMFESLRYSMLTWKGTQRCSWKEETPKRNTALSIPVTGSAARVFLSWHLQSCNCAPYLVSRHDAHHGEEDNWQQGSYSQGHTLCTPVQGHDDDGIATSCFLRTHRRTCRFAHKWKDRLNWVFICLLKKRKKPLCVKTCGKCDFIWYWPIKQLIIELKKIPLNMK